MAGRGGTMGLGLRHGVRERCNCDTEPKEKRSSVAPITEPPPPAPSATALPAAAAASLRSRGLLLRRQARAGCREKGGVLAMRASMIARALICGGLLVPMVPAASGAHMGLEGTLSYTCFAQWV